VTKKIHFISSWKFDEQKGCFEAEKDALRVLHWRVTRVDKVSKVLMV
jgi:hypothetical protein